MGELSPIIVYSSTGIGSPSSFLTGDFELPLPANRPYRVGEVEADAVTAGILADEEDEKLIASSPPAMAKVGMTARITLKDWLAKYPQAG